MFTLLYVRLFYFYYLIFQSPYEELLPFNKFITRLNDDSNLHLYDTLDALKKIRDSNNETIKWIGTMLYKNYSLIDITRELEKDYSCSYLNYWLDEQ